MRTDNYIYQTAQAPEGLHTIIPAKHRVFAPQVGTNRLTLIGNCSGFNINESRTIEPVRGIGKGMQIAELVPGVVEPTSLEFNFFALNLANCFQIFGYNGGVDGFVRSLKHHQWPFDIRSEIVLSRLSEQNPGVSGNTGALGSGVLDAIQDGQFSTSSGYSEKAIVTIYEACWIESWGMDTQETSAVVTQNCSVKATDLVDGQYAGRVGAPTGNGPGSGGGSSRILNGNQLLGLSGLNLGQ